MTGQLLRNDGRECRDEDPWDVFIGDDDGYDPEPEPGDFWPDDDPRTADVDCTDGCVQARRREVLPCSL